MTRYRSRHNLLALPLAKWGMSGTASAREQAEEILDRLNSNPDTALPSDVTVGDIEEVVDPDKPSAHDGDPRRRAEVLHDWVRVTRADSIRGRAELHAGGWHDDSFAASAGLFGGPIRVTPTGMDFDDSHDDPSAVTVTLTLSRTDPFPDVDSIIPEN